MNRNLSMPTEQLQAALGIMLYAQQIEEDHEHALIENATRIRDWATIGNGKKARLVGISRGFGGDNAFYESSKEGEIQKITVAVGWAMPSVWRSAYNTTVFIDDELVAEFNDLEYIQPHVALARLGYIAHGTVDFAQICSPEEIPDGESHFIIPGRSKLEALLFGDEVSETV